MARGGVGECVAGLGLSAAASKSEIYATHRNKLGPEVALQAKVSSTWNLQQLLLLLLLMLPLPMESGQRSSERWRKKKMSTTNENKPNQIYDVPSETMRSRRDDSSFALATLWLLHKMHNQRMHFISLPLRPLSLSPLRTSPNNFVATCDKQMQFAVELHWLYLIIIFDFFVVSLCFVLLGGSACLFLGRDRVEERESG